ncbi:MAG: HPr family phosphocarrier protein [Dissulfurimicrobium sp.]|uniref:HPr family phosphocarrier protein n=1 Tax=Dissulfurimicrobium sp. TaxID=2022436 RepID=UPI00404B42A0
MPPICLETEVTISNRLGLHARPAFRFASLANEFESDVWLIKDNEIVNGKSILEVLTLACPRGSRLRIRVNGPDAAIALSALSTLITDGFGEQDGS